MGMKEKRESYRDFIASASLDSWGPCSLAEEKKVSIVNTCIAQL